MQKIVASVGVVKAFTVKTPPGWRRVGNGILQPYARYFSSVGADFGCARKSLMDISTIDQQFVASE
jgi:hypothetical protein